MKISPKKVEKVGDGRWEGKTSYELYLSRLWRRGGGDIWGKLGQEGRRGGGEK